MRTSLNILFFGAGVAGEIARSAIAGAGHRITPAENFSPDLADRPDVLLSVGYPRKIDAALLNLPRLGAFNVAFSQLPRYRGAFPLRWAILNDEPLWGVTMHQMTAQYCDGPILQRRTVVTHPRDNAHELYLRCSAAAGRAAVDGLQLLAKGDYQLAPAPPIAAPFFSPALPFAGRIDWHQSASKIDCFIRALDFGHATPGGYQHLTPPAIATLGGREIGIWRARSGGTMSVYPPGTITRCDSQVWVQAGRGHVVVEKICVSGIDYDAGDYLASIGVSAGDAFEPDVVWNLSNITGQSPEREFSHAA